MALKQQRFGTVYGNMTRQILFATRSADLPPQPAAIICKIVFPTRNIYLPAFVRKS